MLRPVAFAISTLVFACFAFAQDAPKQVDPLHGRWKLVSQENGTVTWGPGSVQLLYEFNPDGTVFAEGPPAGRVRLGTYKTDITKFPQQLTIKSRGGAETRCIYKIENNVLTLVEVPNPRAILPMKFDIRNTTGMWLRKFERSLK